MEAELLSKMFQNDPRAWAVFFKEYGNLIKAMAVRVLYQKYSGQYQKSQLDDMFAEVSLELVKNDYRRLRLWDPSRVKFSTWLGMIAKQVTIDCIRKDRIRVPLDVDAEKVNLKTPAPQLDAMIHNEQVGQFATVLDRLTPTESAFMDMCYIQDRGTEEIAAQMGISPTTAYTRKLKIHQKLRNALNQDQV